MHPKVAEIIASMSKDFVPNYKEFEENRIVVNTNRPAHTIYILADVCADVLRIDLRYTFGVLNTDNLSAQSLFELLLQNNGSFRMSSSYLAVTIMDNMPVVSFQTNRTFLMEWPSIEIADQGCDSRPLVGLNTHCTPF